MSFQQLIASQRTAPVRRRIRLVLVGLLAGLLALPALAQNNTSSLPSIPDAFQEGGISRVKGYENQAVNEVIDTFTGKLQYHFTDLFIPGNGGMDLAIRRSYNSIDDPLVTFTPWSRFEQNPLGLGWTMHMGRVLRGAAQGICSSSWATSSNNPVLELPDGQRQVLYERGNTWITKDFWRATCPNGFLVVQSPDGTSYEMSAQGGIFGEPGKQQIAYHAGRIVDRHGNWFNLTYQFLPNGVYALQQITTNDGRAVTFAYNGSSLSTITDNTGREWRYTVTAGVGGHNYLDQVQRPDGRSWKYAYHAASPGTGSMRRIEYPTGGSIDYEYGHVNFLVGILIGTANGRESTVVNRKTAATNTADGSSGAWTFSYTVASQAMPYERTNHCTYYLGSIPPGSSQVNTTTVLDPLGTTTVHYHLGVHSARDYPIHVGRKIARQVVGHETEAFVYRDVHISNQTDVAALYLSPLPFGVEAPVLEQHSRFRTNESFQVTRLDLDWAGNPAIVVETANGGGLTHTRQRNLTYAIDQNKWLLRNVATEVVSLGGVNNTIAESYNIGRTFDGFGNLLSQTDAGVQTRFTYHPSGDVATITDPNGNVSSFNGYKRGLAQNENQPEGVEITREVDNAGNLVRETNGRGFTTRYSHDSLGRVTLVDNPISNDVTIDYGLNTKTATRGGMTEVVTIDGLGRSSRRLITGSGGESIAVDFGYDPLGRKVFESYPNSTKGTGTEYDEIGRVVRVLHESTADRQSSQGSEIIRYSGLAEYLTDANRNEHILRYRMFGISDSKELIGKSVKSASEWTPVLSATMERNAKGQIVKATMGGVTREYGYDSRYYLVSSKEPEVGSASGESGPVRPTVFGRDANGNMTSRQVGTQPAVVYAYDGRNRVRTITYPASQNPSVPKAPDVVNTYNKNDQIVSIVAGNVSRTYDYDDEDRLLSESLSVDARVFPVLYAYNENDALTRVTYPSQRVVAYQPDSLGRSGAVLPYASQVTYHASGVPETIRYANGTVASTALNDRQLPSQLRLSRSSGPDVLNSSFTYDLGGNLRVITDSADPAYSRGYSYDAASRIAREQFSTGSVSDFEYNGRGDIVEIRNAIDPSDSIDFSFEDSTGRLTSTRTSGNTVRNLVYDQSGNMIAGWGRPLGFDQSNRIRCVDCGMQGQQADYVYDGAGNRVKSVVGGQTTYSVYTKGGQLLVRETPGQQRREYVYLGRRQIAEHMVRLD